MKCSSCGAEIKEGAEFCVVCGKPLPKRKKCPKCGTEVLEDVMFCTNCGNRFEQKPEPVVYYEEESSNPWK
ncbi:MAG: zinc-ribbon domain-containing protein, partial [Bacteroidaceae bacterium]|nr:zinc-ribbon domain-containing protein [Bacteroidaceae bacterium]